MKPRFTFLGFAAALLLRFLAPLPLHAELTVFVGEPFGNFGSMMPLGHTAIYLSRVCADGPLKLRMCRSDEPQGVVLARYHRIGQYDWLASPVSEFLYAAAPGEPVQTYVTAESAWQARQRYRQRYLNTMVPDGQEGDITGHGGPLEEWWESAGVTFNRRVWGYSLDTTPEQDERFVALMNADPNKHLYHLKKTNCADFISDMVNVYFPHAVHNDRIGDFGLMTPKEVARCVAAFGAAHPELHFHVTEMPQLPGTLRRSRPVRGGAESGLKTKRYLFTLAVIQPEVPTGLLVLYLWHGRWQIGREAMIETPQQWMAAITPTASPVTVSSGAAMESLR